MSNGQTYRLFVVEDDEDTNRALEEYFAIQGYETLSCNCGKKAVEILRGGAKFDLILLDVMLPKMNGFDVLRAARLARIQTPVVMLTAKSARRDIVRGFELGADDYIPKPFSADVLDARIKAVLSRTKAPSDRPMDIQRFGQIEVNFSTNEASRAGRPMSLTPLETKLLRYLIRYPGRVVSRTDLLNDIWDLPDGADTRMIDRHIASLRKKIERSSSEPEHILTVYGRGYRFEP